MTDNSYYKDIDYDAIAKKSKRVDDSKTEVSHMVFNSHINGAGRLFGGQLLMWIDEMAGIVARRHCECNVTTASIDNLVFKQGAFLNDIVVLIGYITYVGNSSMEVRIDTYVEKPDGKRLPINRAFFVMVALNDLDRPTKVPRLIIDTIEEQAKWDAAIRRDELRKIRKTEGF